VTDGPVSSVGLGKKLLLLLLGASCGVLILYIVAALHFSGRTAAHTTVSGIDISNLKVSAAAEKLNAEIAPLAGKVITAQANSKTYKLDPLTAGLSVNAQKTVSRFATSAWNPSELWVRAFGTVELSPEVTVDQEKLDSVLAAIADKSDKSPVEPRINFVYGLTVLTHGVPGNELNILESERLLISAFPITPDTLTLPFQEVAPTVSDAAANNFLVKARQAVAQAVTVTVGNKQASIKPSDLAAALTYVVKDGRLTAVIDGKVLVDSLKSQISGIGNPPVDATFNIVKNKPVVVPGKNGTGINPDQVSQAVLNVIEQPAPRTIALELGSTEPEFTTTDAQSLGINELLSTFTQHFPYAPYRVQNIGQAAKYLDGTIVQPGDVFSMNDTVHERTVENGYTVGYIIGPGGQFLKDLGGGVSTATTAVWTAAFYANMERIEQRAHTIWIPRYRAGLEATVSWGSLDLKWKNTTSTGVLIKASITDTSITVSFYGTKTFDRVDAISGPWRNVTGFGTIESNIAGCEYQGGQDGFDITVTRVVTAGGKVIKREPFDTHYAPEPKVICSKPLPKVPKH